MTDPERWTEQSIRWYAAAAEYTKFGQKLADRLTEFLRAEETVCDLGCGTGCISLELVSRGYAVTAVDRDKIALNWLRGQCTRRNSQVTVLEQDWDTLGSEPLWDNIVMVCAGRAGEDRTKFQRLCRKRLIVVSRVHRNSHIRADGGNSALCIEQPPNDAGGSLAARSFALEFGQPFTSREDAIAYIRHYGGDEDILPELWETGDKKYPVYLPYRKELNLTVYPSIGSGKPR